MNDELQMKLRRIEKVKAEKPVYKEILQFFEKIIKEKSKYKGALNSDLEPIKIDDQLATIKLREAFPLIEKKELKFDYTIMKEYFIKLLAIVQERVNDDAEKIKTRVDSGEVTFEEMVNMALQEEPVKNDKYLLKFLINETINPLLEVYASQLKGKVKEGVWLQGYCPICGGRPLIGVLRSDEGKKFLVCSSCTTEWAFPRIKCPYCGNSDHKKLSYFFVNDDEGYRVEICDVCKKYIKTIDTRKIKQDVSFDVENIATIHLDIVAQGKGYAGDTLILNV